MGNKEREAAKEHLDDLCSLFQDKIQELHNVKGGQTERHVYCYYRALVNQAQRALGFNETWLGHDAGKE